MADQPRGPHLQALSDRARRAFAADLAGRVAMAAEIRARMADFEALASAYERGDMAAAVEASKRIYPFAMEYVTSMAVAKHLVTRERGHDAAGN
jgi:hypothetical protein